MRASNEINLHSQVLVKHRAKPMENVVAKETVGLVHSTPALIPPRDAFECIWRTGNIIVMPTKALCMYGLSQGCVALNVIRRAKVELPPKLICLRMSS